MRIIKIILIQFLTFTPVFVSANIPPPILETSFDYWEHHWFVWLPSHPVYESVEIMEVPSADNDKPLVWVFFSEREGSKKQVHYFNNPEFARSWSSEVHYREMKYNRNGNPNQSQNVSVSLLDKNQKEVNIHISGDGNSLSGGGLTDQSGHSADSLFLIFYRGLNGFTNFNKVLIGGVDYSYNSNEGIISPPPFFCVYSRYIYVATFPYTDIEYNKTQEGLTGSNGALYSFSADNPNALVSTNRSEVQSQSFIWDNFKLIKYSHKRPYLEMTVTFESPLDFKSDGGTSAYTIAIANDFVDTTPILVAGKATLTRDRHGWRLRLSPDQPEWARRHVIEYRIVEQGTTYIIKSRNVADETQKR